MSEIARLSLVLESHLILNALCRLDLLKEEYGRHEKTMPSFPEIAFSPNWRKIIGDTEARLRAKLTELQPLVLSIPVALEHEAESLYYATF